MNDSDLEDIESHLYSQIYHSNEQTDESFNNLKFNNSEESTPDMRKPNRYFQHAKKNNGFFHNKHVQYHTVKPPVQSDYNQSEGLYSKEYEIPHKRDISINQVVVLSTPTQAPIVCLANSSRIESKSAKKRARLKKKKQRREAERQRAIERQREADRQSQFRQRKFNKELAKETENDTIITVSDSDGESCVEIANNWPHLSIEDSDEEDESNSDKKLPEQVDTNASNDNDPANQTSFDAGDDVIFVEPVVAPVEVINVDEEFDTSPQKNPDEANTHADVETASVASSSNSFINTYIHKSPSAKSTHKERKELLSTPDSASNDFMGNSGVELRNRDFRFSLHGSDFNNDKFVKPTNPSEVCETESSSSTTDANALNSLKTAVFNEIEFPKEGIFSEANMESFGNFITPMRKSTGKKMTQNSSPVEGLSPARSQNVYSSDSSSESDFEDNNVKELRKKPKTLPDLSPMISQSIDNLLQAVKKPKRGTNLSSKYDLINSDPSEVVTKRVKQKKRKSSQLSETPETVSSKKKNKNKKRKSDKTVEANSMTDTAPNTSVENNEAVDNDIKRKKKKSRETLEETDENSDTSHSKKKLRTKKKKTLTPETDATVDNVIEEQVPVQTEPNEVLQDKEDHTVEVAQSTSDVVEGEEQKDESSNDNGVSRIGNDLESTETQSETVISNNLQNSDVKIESISEMDKGTENKESGVTETVANGDESVMTEVKQEITVKLESSQEVIILDDSFEGKNDVDVVVLSDSESNLSAPNQIQLANCQEYYSEKQETVAVENQTNKSDINLTHCSLEQVQHTMSNDPKLWTILDIDRYPLNKHSLGRRCNKCREKGHMAIRCPNIVAVKCRLCGEGGHYEPRCPNRICTQCGTRSPYSTTTCTTCFKYRNHQCELCLMAGHPSTACPDLWRRYHLTTTEGPLRPLNGPLLKPKNKLWCSGCARSGHLEYACRYYKSLYPPSDPRIKSYEDVYQDSGAHGSVALVQQQQVGHPLLSAVNNYIENYPMQRGPTEHRYPVYSNQNNYRTNISAENGVFMNNYQNVAENAGALYNPASINYPSYSNHQDQQVFFEDNLPNFISFDDRIPCNNNYVAFDNLVQSVNRSNSANVENEVAATEMKESHISTTANKRIFFSGSVERIQHLIKTELQKLFVLARNANQIVNNLKRHQVRGGATRGQMRSHSRKLNMVLFGIYKLNDGAKHLQKLKNFKMHHTKARLNQNKRKELHDSYCYIFGIDKHYGVDYNELLRRI